MSIILGIDPGTTRVGYGVIQKRKDKLFCIKSGLLNLPKKETSIQLQFIEGGIKKILDSVKPDVIGIERLYFSKNQKTAIKVAQARGVIINTLSKTNKPVIEVSPTEIKLAVTGNGNASKKSVSKMVNYFLENPVGKKLDDVMDALAIAITVSNQ